MLPRLIQRTPLPHSTYKLYSSLLAGFFQVAGRVTPDIPRASLRTMSTAGGTLFGLKF